MFQDNNRVVKALSGAALSFLGAVVVTGMFAAPAQVEAREIAAPYPAVTYEGAVETVRPVDYRNPNNRWSEQERQRYLNRERHDYNRDYNDRYDRQRYQQERRHDRMEHRREMNREHRREMNRERRHEYNTERQRENRNFNRNYNRSSYGGESVPYDFRQYGPNHLRRQSRTERLPASPMMEMEGMQGVAAPYRPNYGARGVYNERNYGARGVTVDPNYTNVRGVYNTNTAPRVYTPTQYRVTPAGETVIY